MTSVTPTERVSGRAWQALAVGAAGYVLFGFNSTATNLAFSAIGDDFTSASEGTLSWVASGYFIATAAFLPLGGRLADRLGRRKVFQFGMAGFCASALLSAFAPTIWLLIAARVVQAIAGAMVIPASLSMILPEFPNSRRSTAVATWAAAGPLSAFIAPSAASAMLAAMSWRWVYGISAPAAAIALLLSWVTVRESVGEQNENRLDLGGTALAVAAISLLIVGISQGTAWGWSSAATVLVIAQSFALAIVFVYRSASHPAPLLNLALLRVPAVAMVNVANFFISITSQSIWLVWPLFLLRIWEYDRTDVGLAITIGPTFAGPASLLGGRLADKYGQRWLMIGGSAISTCALTYGVFSLGAEPNYWLDLAPVIGGFGLGWGLSHPQMNSYALNHVPAENFGETNAAFNTVRNIAAAVGTAGAVAIVGSADRTDALAAFGRANTFFTVWVALAFVTLAIGTWRLERDERRAVNRAMQAR